jgi:hypothetical protein
MLVSAKPKPDFSVGNAGGRIGRVLFATHPLTLRELTLANAIRSKGENGAVSTSSTPFARSGTYEVLGHKLIPVVVLAVI